MEQNRTQIGRIFTRAKTKPLLAGLIMGLAPFSAVATIYSVVRPAVDAVLGSSVTLQAVSAAQDSIAVDPGTARVFCDISGAEKVFTVASNDHVELVFSFLNNSDVEVLFKQVSFDVGYYYGSTHPKAEQGRRGPAGGPLLPTFKYEATFLPKQRTQVVDLNPLYGIPARQAGAFSVTLTVEERTSRCIRVSPTIHTSHGKTEAPQIALLKLD